jgi:hypothetical protein
MEQTNAMTTNPQSEVPPAFLQIVAQAITNLKVRLQHDYQQAYPDLAEIIHLVLDQEEARARELSTFPHLFLPDLVEAHIAKLNLQPAEPTHEELLAPHGFSGFPSYQPAFAFCG